MFLTIQLHYTTSRLYVKKQNSKLQQEHELPLAGVSFATEMPALGRPAAIFSSHQLNKYSNTSSTLSPVRLDVSKYGGRSGCVLLTSCARVKPSSSVMAERPWDTTRSFFVPTTTLQQSSLAAESSGMNTALWRTIQNRIYACIGNKKGKAVPIGSLPIGNGAPVGSLLIYIKVHHWVKVTPLTTTMSLWVHHYLCTIVSKWYIIWIKHCMCCMLQQLCKCKNTTYSTSTKYWAGKW